MNEKLAYDVALLEQQLLPIWLNSTERKRIQPILERFKKAVEGGCIEQLNPRRLEPTRPNQLDPKILIKLAKETQ